MTTAGHSPSTGVTHASTHWQSPPHTHTHKTRLPLPSQSGAYRPTFSYNIDPNCVPWKLSHLLLARSLLAAEYRTTMKSVKPLSTKSTVCVWGPSASAVTFQNTGPTQRYSGTLADW
jgi:hypothetical protein